MTPKLKELSVFFPCYNEEANLETTFNKTLPIIKEIADKWEVIIVDDGSKDNTGAVALGIQNKYPENVRIITHRPNRGYGAAIKSGLFNSRYEWVVFTDSDGQFDFNDVRELIQKQKITNADMVIGYYLNRRVPLYRKIGSKLWQFAVGILFGLWVRDIDCAFKLINQKVIKKLPPLTSERGPFITSEFLIYSQKNGFSIAEVGVHHFSRQAGEATGAKLNVILSGFKDLFRLWFKVTFSAKK